MKEKKPMEFKVKYDMSKPSVIADMVNGIKSGLYGTKNEDGEDVMVMIEQGDEMTVRTFQSNGWLRVNYYNHLGLSEGETFEGRWNK